MSVALAIFNRPDPENELPALSDADLFSDHSADLMFAHLYAEFRKDVEGLKRKAASRYGCGLIQEFLDQLDNAHHDSAIGGWRDHIDAGYRERGE